MGSIVEDLAAKVAAYTTVETSVVALLSDLSNRLKSAVASGDPTQLTGLIAQIDANNAALAASVVVNTVPVLAPPAPVEAVVPSSTVTEPLPLPPPTTGAVNPPLVATTVAQPPSTNTVDVPAKS